MTELPPPPVQNAGIHDYGIRLRNRQITARQAVTAYLARIRHLDRKLGAYTHIAADEAVSAADALDRLLDAEVDLGPLMGVPVAIKDIFAVSGMPAAAGSRVDVRDCIGPEGPFVRALKRQGCIVLGKTRTVEFAAGSQNTSHPTPWNPWDVTQPRTPGGSSHGSAVAVAAGLCAFAVGSDTGGSVRQPAAFNGICGFKPSSRTWPVDGVFPLSSTMDTIGLLCATPRDARFIYETLREASLPRRFSLQGARFAVSVPPGVEPDPDVRIRFETALAGLERAGADLVHVDWPSSREMDEVQRIFAELVASDLLATLGEERFRNTRDVLDPIAVRRLDNAVSLRAVDYVHLDKRRRELAGAAVEWMASCDALVTPTAPVTPPPLAELNSVGEVDDHIKKSLHYTRFVNVYELCAVSVALPARPTELPVGLQVCCAHGEDERLLAMAEAIHATLHGSHEASLPDLSDFGWAATDP